MESKIGSSEWNKEQEIQFYREELSKEKNQFMSSEKKIQGFLRWTDNGWVVDYQVKDGYKSLPLHPDSEKHYLYEDDDKGIEVKFEIVKESIDTEELKTYAKIIIPTSEILYTKTQMEECWNAAQGYRAGYTNVRFEEFINNL